MADLKELLAGLAPDDVLAAVVRSSSFARPVSGVFDDSRLVQPGGVFVAVKGTAADGRRFIGAALERGAAVIVGEGLEGGTGALPVTGQTPVPPLTVSVPDARAALATLALRWYGVSGAPGSGFQLAGVTGTNGKSTSAFMARAILRAAGRKCGLLGTVCYDLCGRTVTARVTTPGALELAAYLRECRDAGADAAVMEVSSHALDQKRTEGLRFAAAAFTNLTGDHLDYHGTFENYRAAKARLFAGLDRDALAIVNRDDSAHEHMIHDCRARVVTYALEREADITASISHSTSQGTYYRMRIDGQELVLENAIVGRHNVYNALTAAGLAWALGAPLDAITAGLLAVRNIPGRLQRVPCVCPADVFVDYAHTDDALRNVLGVLRPLTRGRLIVVFGCGGDRDRTKRPRMARAVAATADAIFVTSDNPRSEDPQAIIAEIMSGFDADARRRVTTEPDRARAISAALRAAGAGDIVLIAGKGHEDYQIMGDRRIHFDDVEVAIQAAAEAGAASAREGEAPAEPARQKQSPSGSEGQKKQSPSGSEGQRRSKR
jgi:UDP-N-acetylmuramoyl-L-alanyl-D-glutamate--2,6-diaminopimelate ligase